MSTVTLDQFDEKNNPETREFDRATLIQEYYGVPVSKKEKVRAMLSFLTGQELNNDKAFGVASEGCSSHIETACPAIKFIDLGTLDDMLDLDGRIGDSLNDWSIKGIRPEDTYARWLSQYAANIIKEDSITLTPLSENDQNILCQKIQAASDTGNENKFLHS